TDLQGVLSAPRWSPDGRQIAFLFIAGRKAAAGPLNPTDRDAGVVGETPEEQRIAVVDLASGTVRMPSPADLFVYEYDWSPDGKTFAAVAAHGWGDSQWWVAELYSIDNAAGTSGTARSLAKPSFQIANPRWSPDGRQIAVLGGLMSDQGANGGDIYVVPAAGGEPRNLTPGIATTPAWLAWTSATRVAFMEYSDGGSSLSELDTASGQVRPLWHAAALPEESQGMPGISLAKDGRTAAAVLSSWTQAPEVWAGPIGSWRPVTGRNTALAPSWGTATNLHWTTDAGPVQGWLLAPPAVEPGKRYPMIVSVHGGPANCAKPGWPSLAGALASQGFFVLMPNPRGSYGLGEAFTRGNVKDFGYGDMRDILGGVEEAVRAAPVDKDRVGLFGWSYGGYIAMWAVTQTDRFRAVVAGAGIVNWQSYYGQNRINTWMIPYFGASVYDDPWIYARSSPISFIKNVKTPTLVLQGERDAEVPAPQAYEFWRALQTLGVDTQLVIYPDEGHRLRPADDRDRIERTVAWFRKHFQ
nr:S9 family peptidase [Acidobacteriota bacterium]